MYTLMYGIESCGVYCQAAHVFVPDGHLDTLFTNITNGTGELNQDKLRDFLSSIHLSDLHDAHDDDTEQHDAHGPHVSNGSECLSASQLFSFFPDHITLNQSQFSRLLPTFLYELFIGACDHKHAEEIGEKKPISWKSIVGCVIAVAALAGSGLVVVVLVPLMSRSFYNVFTQFLIALSVGSLTGDAFLHLIPHALSSGHEHRHAADDGHAHENVSAADSHQEMIVKSLIALLGIYAFFFTERLTILRQNNKAKHKQKHLQADAEFNSFNQKDAHYQPVLNTDNPKDPDSPVAKKEHGGFATTGDNSSAFVKVPNNPEQWKENSVVSVNPDESSTNPKSGSHTNGPVNTLGISSSTQPPNCPSPNTVHKQILSDDHPAVQDTNVVKAVSSAIYTNGEEPHQTHPFQDKPHGHHHGHSHDLSSVRAIAYTIIAGDGLHNFCDGLAIGAAFAIDVRGGLSTSIAVLCHELPHELGDFAVLLHAGLSIKAAILYNLMTSLFCGAGTVIGLLIGQIDTINSWLFMLAAGIFIYIALVDMMPELSTVRLKGHRYCHQPTMLFMWQNMGLLLGISVMLIIALYEHRIA
ncbi:unnamed protein product [Calicophoron daubneyi]|uniref:Zinc transporter ZIP10 n=1 Tax=Calicophoron daubneyi TaxID=300641 RepID=A0AAV2TT24_CALDB